MFLLAELIGDHLLLFIFMAYYMYMVERYLIEVYCEEEVDYEVHDHEAETGGDLIVIHLLVDCGEIHSDPQSLKERKL